MQIRVGSEDWGALAHALRSHFCARAMAPAGPCCAYFLLRGLVYAA